MKTSSTLIGYAFGHFAVDFSCGFILFSLSAGEKLELISASVLFLVYNLLAFGTQFLFGILSDRTAGNGKFLAAAGAAVCAAGLVVGARSPIACVLLMGFGNAAFHVGGGIDAVTRDAGYTRAGMFVSTGALGIALGAHFGEKGKLPVFLFIIALLAAALWILAACDGKKREELNLTYTDEDDKTSPAIATLGMSAVLILGAVLIRSWAGFLAPNAGSESRFAFLIPPMAAFAGKFLGGALADIFGARKTGTLAVLLAIPLYFVGANHFIVFAAAVFCYNIAMPITLVELVRRLKGHEGFAFGLTTLALLLGYLGSVLLPLPVRAAKFAVVFLSFIAAADIYLTSSDRPTGLGK